MMKNLLMSALILAGSVGQTIPAFASPPAANVSLSETPQPNTNVDYHIAELQSQTQTLQALDAQNLHMQTAYNQNAPETLYWLNEMITDR
jgi:hypothetical protein